MKKLLTLSLTLAFLVALAGCNGDSGAPAAKDDGAATTAPAKDEAAPAASEEAAPAATEEPAADEEAAADEGGESDFDDFDYSSGGSASGSPGSAG